MKLLGFLFLLLGGICLALYILYHIIVFLISGSPLLLKGGVLFIVLGFLILLISAMVEKKQSSKDKTAEL
jgi:1,4-dihydroxy-2-naphthoate octaprenyltransferase